MTYGEFENIIRKAFPDITEKKLEQFRKLEGLYRDWNSKINVISRKDIDQLYLHHVLHSLAAAEYLRLNFPEEYKAMSSETGSTDGVSERISLIDVGTGGGFPGIPLAIMFPGADFTLCDSIGKKITVATEVSRAIGLANVTTVNARAESLPQTFDFVVSRAVTSLENFIPWVKGKFSRGILYLKGGDISEEIATAMGKFNLKKGTVHTWPISSWAKDPYFEGKLVIFIEA